MREKSHSNMNGFSFDGRISKVNSDGYIDRATADLESYYLSANYVGDDEIINIINFKGNEVTYQAWYGVPKNYLENDNSCQAFSHPCSFVFFQSYFCFEDVL